MKAKTLARALIFFLPLLWFAASPFVNRAQKAPATEFDSTILPFVADNCIACHNAKKQSGGVDFEQYKSAASILRDRDKWELALEKIVTGEMPPKGAPRPDAAAQKAVVGWLENEFRRADLNAKPDPGRVTARRLNRAEYNNTVRDLLGVDFRPADDFPQDDSGYGFDNIGDVLTVSPVLMEKYLTAAERVARAAIFGAATLKPALTRLRATDRRIKPSQEIPAEYDQTGLSMPNAMHVRHRFPADGEYIFRIFPTGNRPIASEPMQIGIWIDGRLALAHSFDPENLASFEIDRQELNGKVTEARVRVPAGEHWVAISLRNIYEGLPPRYNGPNPSKRTPPPPEEFKPRPGFPPERLAEFKKRFEERRRETQNIAINDARINGVDIGGPYNQTAGPSPDSLKKVYACGHPHGHHTATCARKIVASLARRAWRRPVTAAETTRLTGLISMARRQGDSFEEGLVVAIQAMLVSPHFLFRIENDPALTALSDQSPQPVNQHALASRLSYFLWSSMPDEALSRAADQGALKQPAVLAAQIQRMLKDPKATALVENFGGQWLELRRLESAKPDRERFPDFEEYLRMSMLRETEMFLGAIVREDRSILDLIDANYSYLNERMARFYNIPGVSGPEFRRVELPAESHRGGILTHASVLTVSSYANRTSPVLRGKWILENLLNAPPPPPPPDVPNLDEAKVGTSASLRTQLEEHRKNTTCAACHARMDPLGFGLENFDAVGAWRVKDGSFPIDSAGVLPDGRKFNGPGELKTILRADRDAFARGVTEKLLTYALGRGLERYDKPVVRQIAARVAEKDYRFSSLVLEITRSLPFQMRRSQREVPGSLEKSREVPRSPAGTGTP
ncbi:MAG: DUF1592 domain-containing protein [Blastocatellia bacterium]